MKKVKQECCHHEFYTMGNTVYCNHCHIVLGYFHWEGKLRGFFKETIGTIANEYLNEKTVKIKQS